MAHVDAVDAARAPYRAVMHGKIPLRQALVGHAIFGNDFNPRPTGSVDVSPPGSAGLDSWNETACGNQVSLASDAAN